MQSDELEALANRLNASRHTAATLDCADASIEGAWKPELNKCHENASTWAAHNDGWSAVRGWAVFDLTQVFLALRPVIHFVAHSVVRDPAGKLWDITPSSAGQAYPFFPHPGTDQEFEEIVEVHRLEAVDYFPPT